MKFIDVAKITVRAGNGGNGIIAYLREMGRPYGGPAGGNGGRGGNVIFVGDVNVNTLIYFQHHKIITAKDGVNGGNKNQHGANGEDFYVSVPLGTIVYDNETNTEIGTIFQHKQELIVCHGGKGGRGNASFKTQKNTAPDFCDNGDKGEELRCRLELQIIANVGIIGLPNAGKSTLISKISAARPKIADYPFTTISPVLGVVRHRYEELVFADIPGLIEGANQGKGLGINFLKHIQRCTVLLHLIAADSENADLIYENYCVVMDELKAFSEIVANKPQIIVLNKTEFLSEETTKKIKAYFENLKLSVLFISAIKSINISEMLDHVFQTYEIQKNLVLENDIHTVKDYDAVYTLKNSKNAFLKITPKIIKNEDTYELFDPELTRIFLKIPLISTGNFQRINIILKSLGVFEQLVNLGIKKGDKVKINDFEFE